jgi:hypothetical protein
MTSTLSNGIGKVAEAAYTALLWAYGTWFLVSFRNWLNGSDIFFGYHVRFTPIWSVSATTHLVALCVFVALVLSTGLFERRPRL